MRKTLRSRWIPPVQSGLLAATLTLLSVGSVSAQPYNVGNIVTNEITLQNRLRWTNDNGIVFMPSNTVLRLSDFDGAIVFFVFFDVW
jgi:hypothetical protein